MVFWVNKKSSTDNVLVLARNGVLIASCDEEQADSVVEQLTNKKSPTEIFGKDNIEKVPFLAVTNIVSRNTDCDVYFYYKEGKKENDMDYEFSDEASRQQCLNALTKVLPENFKKNVSQQSALVAALPAFFSLLVGLGAGYLYFNKWRWVTVIVGGIWVALSLWQTYYRISKPPEVTRWGLKGKYIGKAWGKLKTGASFVVAAALVIGFSFSIPVEYGSTAILEKMEYEELDVDMLDTLLNRGADISLKNREGSAPLHLAIGWSESEVVKLLIARGADTQMLDGDGSSPLILAIEQNEEDIIWTLLNSGKPLGELRGMMKNVVYSELSAKLLDALVDHGLNINEQDEEGVNALKQALYEGSSEEFVQSLLERNVSSDFTMDNKSIEEYLKEADREDLRALFIEKNS